MSEWQPQYSTSDNRRRRKDLNLYWSTETGRRAAADWSSPAWPFVKVEENLGNPARIRRKGKGRTDLLWRNLSLSHSMNCHREIEDKNWLVNERSGAVRWSLNHFEHSGCSEYPWTNILMTFDRVNATRVTSGTTWTRSPCPNELYFFKLMNTTVRVFKWADYGTGWSTTHLSIPFPTILKDELQQDSCYYHVRV